MVTYGVLIYQYSHLRLVVMTLLESINIKDYIKTLEVCLDVILCYNGELDNKDPSLGTSVTGWFSKI
jgi:hypothetical protein